MGEQLNEPFSVSNELSDWLAYQEILAKHLKNGGETDNAPEFLRQSDEHRFIYNERWGKWEKDYSKLENAKCLAYMIAEQAIVVSRKFDEEARVKGVRVKYPRLVSGGNIAGSGDNLLGATLATTFITAYHEILDDIHSRGDLREIDFRYATRISADFAENVLSQITDSLDGKTHTLPYHVLPFVTEALREIQRLTAIKIEAYQQFNSLYPRTPSKKSAEVNEKLSAVEQQLKALERSKNDNETASCKGWLFYSAQRTIPIKFDGNIFASHCPVFPITDYYNQSSHAGILLSAGEVLQAFPTNFLTHPDEIKLGKEWTLDKSLTYQEENLRFIARKAGRTFDEEVGIMREWAEPLCGLNLQQAWDRRIPKATDRNSRGFTEVWIDEPFAYALWLDTARDYSFYSKPTELLNSRPDLPILDMEGNLISRSDADKIINPNLDNNQQ